MTTKVTPTGAFLRDLKRLGKGARQDDAIAAIELFVENPQAASLNFEPIRSQKGYYSIRANYHDRLLLRMINQSEYEAVATTIMSTFPTSAGNSPPTISPFDQVLGAGVRHSLPRPVRLRLCIADEPRRGERAVRRAQIDKGGVIRREFHLQLPVDAARDTI
jgi:hypothetical protein